MNIFVICISFIKYITYKLYSALSGQYSSVVVCLIATYVVKNFFFLIQLTDQKKRGGEIITEDISQRELWVIQ